MRGNRRVAVFGCALAVMLTGLTGMVAGASDPVAASTPEQRVRALLARVPLIDGHNDFAWELRDRTDGRLDRIDLAAGTLDLARPTQTDLPRLRAGMVGAQVFAIYVPVSKAGPGGTVTALEQIDLMRRAITRYPQALELATTAADIERIHEAGRIAALLSIEGAHVMSDSLAVLRTFHALGVRSMTLTHWSNTAWADAATDQQAHGGLSDFGREVIREMNRLGLLVDLSHVSPDTMRDALEVSDAPVIFSHSSARALVDHPRNVPDDVLRVVADKGGMVMVNFTPMFLSEQVRADSEARAAERARLQAAFPNDEARVREGMAAWRKAHPAPRATLAQAADHAEHIRRVAGIDHVGIGSDFDGISTTPLGLEDVSRFPDLLVELARRGWSDEDLAKMAGGNYLRVMRAAEQVAARLQREREPSAARIEDRATQPAAQR